MKVLTVRQPWAGLIMLGFKTVENRSWATDYRGKLLIHAGRTTHGNWGNWEPYFKKLGWKSKKLTEDFFMDRLGKIICSVELVDCVEIGKLSKKVVRETRAEGPFCWMLEKPRMLNEMPQAKGMLGLWDYKGL